MLRKDKLMHGIEELVTHPRVDDPAWRKRLRCSVNALDRLEMPYVRWDRVRFAQWASRDTHIEAIRALFPEVFISKTRATVDGPFPADAVFPDEPPC
jgi:hypothetical protein